METASFNTPEFLVWAVEYACHVRGLQDGSNPERIERQLRAARAVSDARREGRVLDGLCIDGPDGFKIDEAMAIYGGAPAVEACCRGCPANAADQFLPNTWAGCYGFFPRPSNSPEFFAAIEAVVGDSTRVTECATRFPTTRPAWYGLWLSSPLGGVQVELLSDLLSSARLAAFQSQLAELQAALAAATEAKLRLHTEIYPPGRVEQSWWRLAPHCPRCKAVWIAAPARQCGTCSYSGPPAPEKKRHARGRRPYFPLDRLLGSEASTNFLAKYDSYRKQRTPTPAPQTPPPAAPPNILRDD